MTESTLIDYFNAVLSRTDCMGYNGTWGTITTGYNFDNLWDYNFDCSIPKGDQYG